MKNNLNNSIRRIVFWEPTLSPHKIDLVNALKEIAPEIEVIYLSAKSVSEDRKRLGWSISGFEDCIVDPSNELIRKLLLQDIQHTFHIFSGLKGGRMFENALSITKKYKLKFALMSEPRANEGIKGGLRFIHSWITERWIRNQARYIFAIGAGGIKWFRSVGYKAEKIKPFAYFISEEPYKNINLTDHNKINIGFVGRTVKEKGFQTFLEVAEMFSENINFIVVGGEKVNNYHEIENIHYYGSVTIDLVPEILSSIDILIAPSIVKDGWCVTVSEALLSGCYIITTNKVGASLLLYSDVMGTVVDINNPIQITQLIKDVQQRNLLSIEMRRRRKCWALKNLSAKNGAKYLLETISQNPTENIFFDKKI